MSNTYPFLGYRKPQIGAVTRAVLDKFAEMMPTPQDYGAIADGTSHYVSEWIPSRFQNMTDLIAAYPHVVSQYDEIDWAASQQAVTLNKSVYFPATTGAYVFGNVNSSHPLRTVDDSQILIGQAKQGPYGTSLGTVFLGGYGVDILSCPHAAAHVQNITFAGRELLIASVTGNPAVLTVNSGNPHGLPRSPVFTNGWNISGNTTGARSIFTTSGPHYLATGDWIHITGSAEAGANGFWQVNVCDASAAVVDDYSQTNTHFTLVRDQYEPALSTNGGACTFTRVFPVIIGSYYGSGPGGTVTGAVPTDGSGEVLGRYLYEPTSTTAGNVYKYDRTALGLSVNATPGTGRLYVTRRGVGMGTDGGIDNYNNSPDTGKLFSVANLFIKACVTGFYGGSSDGGGKVDHIQVSVCGTGIHADGNLDTMLVEASWIDSSMFAGYRVARNGGMLVVGGGVVNACRPVYVGPADETSFNGGSSFYSIGMYFEGHQRDTFPDGSQHYYVDITGNNGALIIGSRFQDTGEDPIHFHAANGGNLTILSCGSFTHQLKAYSQMNGGRVFGDVASNVRVNLFGSSPTSFDIGDYIASDYLVYTSDNPFNTTQPISGFSQSGSNSTLTVTDGTRFIVGDYINTYDTSNANNNFANKQITAISGNQLTVVNAGGVSAGGGGIVERLQNGIEGANKQRIGHKTMIQPWSPDFVAHGYYQIVNIDGTPRWYQTAPTTSYTTHTSTTPEDVILKPSTADHLLDLSITGATSGAGVQVFVAQEYGRQTGDKVKLNVQWAGDASILKVYDSVMKFCGINGTTTLTMDSTAGLSTGMPVTGYGIPTNTTITAVTSSTTVTMSQAAVTTSAAIMLIGKNLIATQTNDGTVRKMNIDLRYTGQNWILVGGGYYA